MATAAAGQIQHLATRCDRARPAINPLRRLIKAMDLILWRCGNDRICRAEEK
jgi:hypothetical protein